ncbi:MAG: hypothetical protein ACXQTS_06390, partial [Candidatus Methanospirareceae archaeon]
MGKVVDNKTEIRSIMATLSKGYAVRSRSSKPFRASHTRNMLYDSLGIPFMSVGEQVGVPS